MKDQLISFKTAKLAKEKGFDILDEDTNPIYTEQGHFSECGNGFCDTVLYCASTQSLMQKWLREAYDIHIEIHQNTFTKTYRVDLINDSEPFCTNEYGTYEYVLELGLIEALNLIK